MEQKKLVLLVDDNEILRHGMRLILESENFLVEEAGDGFRAKECLSAAHFDLVISAVEMPVMDGLQLLKHCKETSSSRFLLVSEFPQNPNSSSATAMGPDRHLGKPFGKFQLLEAVHGALEKNGTSKGLDQDIVPQPVVDVIAGTILKLLKGLS